MPEQEGISLTERLASEYAAGRLDTERTPQVANVPSVAADLDSMKKAIDAIRQVIGVREGRTGSVMDKHLTLRDLVDSGTIQLQIGNDRFSGNGTVSGLSGFGGVLVNVTANTSTTVGYVDPRPSYSTPPTITGLAASAAFKNIVLTWDIDTINYINFAFVEVWRNTADNLASAVLIGTSTSSLYDDVSGSLGATYYYWVRARNSENTPGAFNAVSGVSASLLKIGNTDLGPLVVEAGNLASGAVTATKLAANAVALTNFASGIEPVSVVSSLPSPSGYTGAKVVLLTTDGKLYRYASGAWTVAVPAADVTGTLTNSQIADLAAAKLTGQITSTQITDGAISTPKLAAGAVTANELAANSVVAGKVAAGAISADQLAVGAVTAKAITITDLSNLCFNGQGLSLEGWATTGSMTADTPGFSAYWTTVGVQSDSALTFRARDSFFGYEFPVKPGEEFFVSADAVPTGGGAATYATALGFQVFNVAHTTIGWFAGASTAGAGYSHMEGVATMPAGAATAIIWVQVDGPAGGDFSSSGHAWHYTNIRVYRRNAGSLIVDGAVHAQHLAANSIAVGTAAIQNGAIVNAMIANAAIDDAKIANLDAVKITAGTLDANRIGVGTLTGNKLQANTIDVGQLNASLLNSDNVLTRGLTVRDNSGTILLSSGINLDSSRVNPSGAWLNSNITISSSGVLSGAGGGAVTVAGLDNSIVRSANPITSGNVSTYISAAAIDLARINTASIGSLSALSASLGSVDISTTGYLKSGQTGYNSGTGFWLGLVSGVPKFSIGNSGGANMRWDGTDLFINTPTFDSFTVSITGGDLTTSTGPVSAYQYGSRTAVPSGGKAPYTYQWVLANGGCYDITYNLTRSVSSVWFYNESSASQTAYVAGTGLFANYGSSGAVAYQASVNHSRLICLVKDANGRMTMASVKVTAVHDVYPENVFDGGGSGGSDGGS